MSGGQLTYTIKVTNTGALPDEIKLSDLLPGNGGPVWASATPSAGTCDPIVNNLLTCDFGTVAAGAFVTVTVQSTASTPAAACQDQPNNIVDVVTGLPGAVATDDHGNKANDTGDLTCTTNLVTVTQGGWHATPHGNNPGTILNAYYTAHPGHVFTIGGTGSCVSPNKATFNSANAIRAFLPATSTPGSFTTNYTNPTTPPGTSAGVFAGQVLALTLNTQVLSSGGALLSFVITSGPATGKTVAQVLADANAALGCGTLPSYVTSISQLNDVVTSINEMFD